MGKVLEHKHLIVRAELKNPPQCTEAIETWMKEAKFTPEQKRLEVAKYIKEHPEYKLIDLASAAERDVSELRTFKRTQVAAKKPREEIKKTEEKITKIMTMFNNRVRQAEKDEIRAKK